MLVHWAGNILSGSSAAPTIQSHQKELERSMLEDSLKEKLAHRPQPAEVIEKGILNGKPVSLMKIVTFNSLTVLYFEL